MPRDTRPLTFHAALTGLLLAACASTGATSGLARSGGGDCSIELAPRQAPVAPATRRAVRIAPPSQVIVHVDAPLGELQQTLERRIATRLSEARFGIGPAGTLTYRAERGPLSWSVSSNALVIEAPVHARAEACRGGSCYASCEPEAIARAEVPLLLRPDYRFARSSVSVRFTRGCKVRTLGGLLTVDLTPTIQARLEPELARLGSDIDRQLPDLRRDVERGWRELSTPRPLPLLGCLVIAPHGIVQGPLSASAQTLHARFALLATPELRRDCPGAPRPEPLPALTTDPALPQEAPVTLGLVTPLSSLERAFSGPVSNRGLRVARAGLTARGSAIDAELTLAGGVCGSLALEAEPEFSGQGEHIELVRPQLAEAEARRLRDRELDPPSFVNELVQLPRLTPLLSVTAVRDAAPRLAAALSQSTVAISAQVSASRAAGAAARGEELVAWIEMRGAVRLTPQLDR